MAWNSLVPASDFSVPCRPQWHLVDCDEKTRGNGGFTTCFHQRTTHLQIQPTPASLRLDIRYSTSVLRRIQQLQRQPFSSSPTSTSPFECADLLNLRLEPICLSPWMLLSPKPLLLMQSQCSQTKSSGYDQQIRFSFRQIAF